jgi:phytanoyl-CoA hydroxylase
MGVPGNDGIDQSGRHLSCQVEDFRRVVARIQIPEVSEIRTPAPGVHGHDDHRRPLLPQASRFRDDSRLERRQPEATDVRRERGPQPVDGHPADDADLQTVDVDKGRRTNVAPRHRHVGLDVEQIGRQHGKPGTARQGFQRTPRIDGLIDEPSSHIDVTELEVMIADGGCGVAECVIGIDDERPFAHVGFDAALVGIAGIENDDRAIVGSPCRAQVLHIAAKDVEAAASPVLEDEAVHVVSANNRQRQGGRGRRSLCHHRRNAATGTERGQEPRQRGAREEPFDSHVGRIVTAEGRCTIQGTPAMPPPSAASSGFSSEQVARFERDGFVIERELPDRARCAALLAVVQAHLAVPVAPIEYEADTTYPGAPASRDEVGGRTVRRLLGAYARDDVFRQWVRSDALSTRLRQLLGPSLVMSQAHHNCIMTKAPAYSSVTGWHQDIRYWSFTRPDLVSVWLALTPETASNGCLLLVPGSHRMALRPDQYDADQFFRTDTNENQSILAGHLTATLEPGDVLFFHARLLHAAGRNVTSTTKLAPVFTFHALDNQPLPHTRSASLPEVALP